MLAAAWNRNYSNFTKPCSVYALLHLYMFAITCRSISLLLFTQWKGHCQCVLPAPTSLECHQPLHVSFIFFLRWEFQVEVLSPGVCILVLKTTAFRFPASWYFELLIYFKAIMCFPEHICDCWCLEVSVIYMWCTAFSQLHLCQLRCLVGVSVYMWRKKSNEPFYFICRKTSAGLLMTCGALWCLFQPVL